MTTDEKVELHTLGIILDDRLICKRVMESDPNTFDRLICKYQELVDKFIEEYKLPNLIKGPLTD